MAEEIEVPEIAGETTPEGTPVESSEQVEFTLPEDFAAQVQAWDVPVDKLPEAVETYKRLQSEEGVIDTFIQTGQALGFGIRELETLFADPAAAAPAAPAAPAPVVEEQDPERLMTYAEFRDLAQKEILEPINQARQAEEQRRFQERAENTFSQINAWFDQHEVTDQEERNQIARIADDLIPAGADSYDPRVAITALEQGLAQRDAQIERAAQAYLAKKAATATSQPTALGGGQTGAGEGDDRPDYKALGRNAFEAARERVRARARANGDLG
jgi:hypothetical protein